MIAPIARYLMQSLVIAARAIDTFAMKSRKSIHLFVIALCLWLPLQAIAGQWLHCAQVELSLGHARDLSTGIAKTVATDTVATHMETTETKNLTKVPGSCHQQAHVTTTSPDQNDSQDTSPAKKIFSCKHCQFVCHWHCVLLVEELLPEQLEVIPHHTPFRLPSPQQPLLPQQQKPPRFLAV